MIRRYDMTRSDNFPFAGKMRYPCSGDGEFYVYAAFPVQTALVTPIGLPGAAKLYANGRTDKTGFWVSYSDVPEELGYVEFSFIAQ